MSSLTNDLSKGLLGMRYTPVSDYLPGVVEAAMAIPPERITGYEGTQGGAAARGAGLTS